MGLLSIMARLGLNTSGFEVGLKRVESLSQKTGNLVSGHLKGQLAAAFGVYALQRASAETIKFGSELTDLSKIASTTTARMQELNYAATQDGATMQDMTKAMRKLAEAREDALKNPGGDKASAFANFGIGAAELASLKDMGELLLRVGDGVKGVNLDANSTPQILSLIGTKGSAILPAMIAGLRESGDEAKRLNLILGTETVAALDRMGDAADRMWLGLKGPIAEMTVGVLRLLLDLNALVRMLPSVGTLIASGFLLPFAKAFEFIDAGFDKLMGVKSDGKFTAQRKKLEAELLAAEDNIARLVAEHESAIDDTVAKKKKGIDLDDPNEEAATAVKAAGREASLERLKKLYEDIQDIQRKTAEIGMSDAEKRASMEKHIAELKAALLRMNPRFGIEGGTDLERAQKLKEIAQAENELAQFNARDQGQSQTPMQFDSLARIGGLGMNADNGAAMRTPLERIARATEETVKVIQEGGGDVVGR